MNLLIALATSATLNITAPSDVPLNPPKGFVPPEMQAKQPFKTRHPKLYGAARRVRTIAIFVSPIVRVGGEVAQILLYVVPRR